MRKTTTVRTPDPNNPNIVHVEEVPVPPPDPAAVYDRFFRIETGGKGKGKGKGKNRFQRQEEEEEEEPEEQDESDVPKSTTPGTTPSKRKRRQQQQQLPRPQSPRLPPQQQQQPQPRRQKRQPSPEPDIIDVVDEAEEDEQHDGSDGNQTPGTVPGSSVVSMDDEDDNDDDVAVVDPLAIAPPAIELNEEARFVLEVEGFLQREFRNALQPLYNFLHTVALQLNMSDVRPMYRFRAVDATTEEYQGIIYKTPANAHTVEELLRINQFTIPQELLVILLDAYMDMSKKAEIAAVSSNAQRIMIGSYTAGAPGGADVCRSGTTSNIGERFGAAAMNNWRAAVQNRLAGAVGARPMFGDFIWCCLADDTFRQLMADNVVAACNWVISELHRANKDRGFTVKILVSSPQVNDLFAQMVYNKYILTTGTASAHSVDVGGGGPPRQRLVIQRSQRSEQTRAFSSRTGKIFFDDVFVVYNRQREIPEVIRQLILDRVPPGLNQAAMERDPYFLMLRCLDEFGPEAIISGVGSHHGGGIGYREGRLDGPIERLHGNMQTFACPRAGCNAIFDGWVWDTTGGPNNRRNRINCPQCGYPVVQ